jgi:hypothetical protein
MITLGETEVGSEMSPDGDCMFQDLILYSEHNMVKDEQHPKQDVDMGCPLFSE